MKDCYCDLGLHFILLDDSSQSYILKLRDRWAKRVLPFLTATSAAAAQGLFARKKLLLDGRFDIVDKT
jgi:hypothetical protein